MKLTSRKQFAQAQLELMRQRPVASCEAPGSRHDAEGGISGAGGPRPKADAMNPSLYSLARQVKDDVQGALDYLAPGPRQDEERARKLLLQAADRIALSGEVGL